MAAWIATRFTCNCTWLTTVSSCWLAAASTGLRNILSTVEQAGYGWGRLLTAFNLRRVGNRILPRIPRQSGAQGRLTIGLQVDNLPHMVFSRNHLISPLRRARATASDRECTCS